MFPALKRFWTVCKSVLDGTGHNFQLNNGCLMLHLADKPPRVGHVPSVSPARPGYVIRTSTLSDVSFMRGLISGIKRSAAAGNDYNMLTYLRFLAQCNSAGLW